MQKTEERMVFRFSKPLYNFNVSFLFLSVDCQPGQFYSEATRSCQNCLTGTYQDQSGQFTCIDCPVGFTTTVTLKDSKDDCEGTDM